MKVLLGLLLVLQLLSPNTVAMAQVSRDQELKGTITMSGAWALYPMAVKWAEEFQKIHPKVKIDIGAGGAGKGMADCLAGVVDLGMVSREIYPEEINKGAWWVSVTKDAVVPTVNSNNPVINELLARGVTKETFQGICISGGIESWGQVIEREIAHTIHVYTRSDACGAAETWANFLGAHQEDLQDVGVYGDPGLAEVVKKDVLGIGFNNINYAYDTKSKRQIQGIRVIPIDLNNNRSLDENESFYDTRDELITAIASGEYPSPPARDLHLVAHGRPVRQIVLAFINWILGEGQQYLSESGYITLSEEKIRDGLNKLK